MNRWIRTAAAGLVLVVAACSDGSSGSPLAPDSARFSTPITGGNKEAQDTVFVANAAADTTSADRSTPITGGN
jgi:hypothetical protein